MNTRNRTADFRKRLKIRKEQIIDQELFVSEAYRAPLWRLAKACVPGGARFSRVQVPNPPGSGKDIAEGKGVHREVESEGSRIWGTY